MNSSRDHSVIMATELDAFAYAKLAASYLINPTTDITDIAAAMMRKYDLKTTIHDVMVATLALSKMRTARLPYAVTIEEAYAVSNGGSSVPVDFMTWMRIPAPGYHTCLFGGYPGTGLVCLHNVVRCLLGLPSSGDVVACVAEHLHAHSANMCADTDWLPKFTASEYAEFVNRQRAKS